MILYIFRAPGPDCPMYYLSGINSKTLPIVGVKPYIKKALIRFRPLRVGPLCDDV
jgi:hypothetical protein